MADVSLLDQIRIASPCTASWDDMKGDERVRHCEECRLNVFNLSSMTRDEAEQLIIEKEGRLCVTYFRRKDGTILTRDCPVGWARARRALMWTISEIAAVLTLAVTLCLGWLGCQRSGSQTRGVHQLQQPGSTSVPLLGTPAPAQNSSSPQDAIQGEIAPVQLTPVEQAPLTGKIRMTPKKPRRLMGAAAITPTEHLHQNGKTATDRGIDA